MFWLTSAVCVVVLALGQPANNDNEAKAALALAKAKVVVKNRIAANVAQAVPEKCDGTCCDSLDAARKTASEKRLPIVLFIGTAPKPADIAKFANRAIPCCQREYEVDLDPADAAVYKAAPRVWLLTFEQQGVATAFKLARRWSAAEFTAEKALSAAGYAAPPK